MSVDREPLLELFAYETNQLLELIEGILLKSEQNKTMSGDEINEVFRAMHSIKGSATMMEFKNIAACAHAAEDLFDFIRNKPDTDISLVFDCLFAAVDFMKSETEKAMKNMMPDGDEIGLVNAIREIHSELKSKTGKDTDAPVVRSYLGGKKAEAGRDEKKYVAKVFFEEDCQMENVRAFSLVYTLNNKCSELYYYPHDIEDDGGASAEYIRKNGFDIYFASHAESGELELIFKQTMLLKSYEIDRVDSFDKYLNRAGDKTRKQDTNASDMNRNADLNSFISVSSKKLDKLLDLVGEIVIAESMIAKHPDIRGIVSESFDKRMSHLGKLIEELQDNVMSIRMIPIAETLHKMNRIVRDMGKKLNKQVELIIRGAETEIDKNIVSTLSDPLMHIIRNCMDHGIENAAERAAAGKDRKGRIEISAGNTGGEVEISISDDGRGLDRSVIYKKAFDTGLIQKLESECTDREIFSCILKPGFSTKEKANEFSGRGVGLDVVTDCISRLGGVITIDSEQGKGATFTLHIPLTVAIVDGITVSVGESIYTIPAMSIREFFRPDKKSIVVDTNGNESVLVRDSCIPVVRLHNYFNTARHGDKKLTEGVLILAESNNKYLCLFADGLIGEQYVVTKPLPVFLNRYEVAEKGISGCTILGDGSISLILDVNSIVNRFVN
ncbi:MAG: chemotaxis protein CheA [Clostridiales bacterium]|nr:chemotaxis protein CheA [Clostridiales bacterium]